jgi:hypothetical protein
MDLGSFASRFVGVRWLSDLKFQSQCPCASHSGGDSELSLLARQDDDHILVGCFGGVGDTTDAILSALGLTEADLIIKAAANGSNGTKPHPPSLQAWMILVFRVAKAILERDAGQNPELLASAPPEVLVDGVMKDLRRGVDAGQLNPLPDINLTELEEQLEFVAREAVKDFRAAHTKKAAAAPPQEPEEKISALSLNQLYSVIDEWDRRPWVWDGNLPHSSVSIIVGKSETGKSTDVYSLIYHVVTGTEFFGRQCERGRVVYLAGDPMSEVVAGKTFRALGLEDGVIVVPDALVMYPTGIQQLRNIVQEFKPSLIIGDTLAATVDIDVDKYGDSYRAQMPLTRIARDFGPNFLMSHHSQKSAIDSYTVIDAALGSVGVAAVASTRMATKLHRRKGHKYYTFEMSNLRIGRPLEGEFIIHKLEDGLVELAGLWRVENTAQDKAAILDVLKRRGEPMSKRTLWQETRPRPKWEPYNDALDELIAEGTIRIESGKRGGQLFSPTG